MSRFKRIEDVWSYLDVIPKFQNVGASAANFGLERILQLSEEMGGIHAQFPAIHVAGTNGKGTVCALLAEVYKESGYKVGMFSSPHLLRYNERVQISGVEVEDELILEFFNEAWELLDLHNPTYFEISCLLAFWVFAKEEVDLAVIETGLGGRLDSTNIVKSVATVITSIGLDHQDILGESLEEIAAEKAGIIKEGVPLIIGDLDSRAVQVVMDKAEDKGVIYYLANDVNPLYRNGLIEINNPDLSIQTSFLESINKWNVAMVVLTVKAIEGAFPVSTPRLLKAIESFKGLPARFEKLSAQHNWYFTGAHNEQALESMVGTLNTFGEQEPVLILSMMKDKLTPESLNQLKVFQKRYYYPLTGDRAASHAMLSNHLDFKLITEENKRGVLKELETSLVIFAGSFYFYPTVKQWMHDKNNLAH